LTFADTAALKKSGRSFNCETCPSNIQRIRKCREPRWDFTSEDSNIFPIYIQKGGPTFSFCPSKVARDDYETSELYRTLVLCAEMKQFPYEGGMLEQPDWLIEQLMWFLTRYDDIKFTSRMSRVFGNSGEEKKQNSGMGKKGGVQHKNRH